MRIALADKSNPNNLLKNVVYDFKVEYVLVHRSTN